ncbi:MAG: hypothetical protein IPP74_12090 [Alphaproteobacteria bacterium]|nr:hypothetical protein [Alphaproteobacteria bacterium]
MFYSRPRPQTSPKAFLKPAIALVIVAVLGGTQLWDWWSSCRGSRLKEVSCAIQKAHLFDKYEKQTLPEAELTHFSTQFSQTDIPVLLKLLEQKDTDIAYGSALVLGEFSQSALEPLLSLLSSPSTQTVTSAKLALARMKPHQASLTPASILSLLDKNVQWLKQQSEHTDCSFVNGILLGTFRANNLTQAQDAPQLLTGAIKTLPKQLVRDAIAPLKEQNFPLEIDVYRSGHQSYSVMPVSAQRKTQCQNLIQNNHTLTIIAILRTLASSEQHTYCHDAALHQIHPQLHLKLNEICTMEPHHEHLAHD